MFGDSWYVGLIERQRSWMKFKHPGGINITRVRGSCVAGEAQEKVKRRKVSDSVRGYLLPQSENFPPA